MIYLLIGFRFLCISSSWAFAKRRHERLLLLIYSLWAQGGFCQHPMQSIGSDKCLIINDGTDLYDADEDNNVFSTT